MADTQVTPDETRTTCPYCGVGCGVLATPAPDGLSAEVRGDPDHPANFGRLCSKGSALGETLDMEERLLFPTIKGERASWDDALEEVAATFKQTIKDYGPDSVAFYVSGQLLTEDYYVANKLMKGFIGSGNIDTNSRLCMSSSVAGHKRAFGADTVPGCYDDLEKADLIVMVGSNFAWCHPVLHQRLLAAKETRNFRLVVIDPRATATTEAADLHLPITPGGDRALFNALFAYLANSNAFDKAFVEANTSGLEAALDAAGELDLASTSETTGLSQTDLMQFFEWVRDTQKTVTIYSQGVNQSSIGVDKVNAIINCHLATGRIGKPGMGPFSITGQPNAMGGREVGGLANQLVAHMDFDPADLDRVQRFWDTPNLAQKPGRKAVDMFDAVADGRIKAIWIMATNPVVSMPNADKVRAALEACPFVCVSDVVSTSDTVRLADVALPATAWAEKSGTVTNSERRISRQRSFLKAPGEARGDWKIMCDVATAMGYAGFDYENEAAVFREYAELTAFENDDTRDFDIGALSTLSNQDYDVLAPFQWPLTETRERPGDTSGDNHRFFANGQFYTKDRKARFIATPDAPHQQTASQKLPFLLNTGRVRDHWHTMTRTAKTPRLSAHIAEPFLEIHPEDASALNIAPADLVEIHNQNGSAVLRAQVTDRVKRGELFAPMHWTARYSQQGRVDALVSPVTDPVSGQPEFKRVPVTVQPLSASWQAFAVLIEEPSSKALQGLDYWALARANNGWRCEMAGSGDVGALLNALMPQGDVLRFDMPNGALARAIVKDDKLVALFKLSPKGPVSTDRDWLSSQLGETLDDATRLGVLAGRPPAGQSAGRIVCACMGIGTTDIEAAIKDGGCTVADVGKATTAGTNCGSCKPEINKLIQAMMAKETEDA